MLAAGGGRLLRRGQRGRSLSGGRRVQGVGPAVRLVRLPGGLRLVVGAAVDRRPAAPDTTRVEADDVEPFAQTFAERLDPAVPQHRDTGFTRPARVEDQ
ncbi:hypothetical protein [Streptomyces fradiae]|uniref:hypothetical protein n=1 Tax=Streptomyces fradiae TaxID=1906 RepID=UPI00358DC9D6